MAHGFKNEVSAFLAGMILALTMVIHILLIKPNDYSDPDPNLFPPLDGRFWTIVIVWGLVILSYFGYRYLRHGDTPISIIGNTITDAVRSNRVDASDLSDAELAEVKDWNENAVDRVLHFVDDPEWLFGRRWFVFKFNLVFWPLAAAFWVIIGAVFVGLQEIIGFQTTPWSMSIAVIPSAMILLIWIAIMRDWAVWKTYGIEIE